MDGISDLTALDELHVTQTDADCEELKLNVHKDTQITDIGWTGLDLTNDHLSPEVCFWGYCRCCHRHACQH